MANQPIEATKKPTWVPSAAINNPPSVGATTDADAISDPLIVTALSPILLNEVVGFRRWAAVITGFLGSLIVIRPGFMEINLASIAALGTGVL